MKLWVDDMRPEPKGWTRVYTAEEAISIIDDIYPIEEISLDHDLGDTDHDPEWTGYTVLVHIESKVVWDDSYLPPNKIHIHTDNAGVRSKMEAGIASITRFTKLKKTDPR